MRVTEMHVENFLSFGVADFNFDRAGLVLVEGDNRDDPSASSNGSGKSSMIDALVWCLFGTTLRGYDKDEVVNRHADGGCLVCVTMNDGERSWDVTRARRHPKRKNTLSLEETDEGGATRDLSRGSNQETQELVDGVLGCTLATFLSSVVFGQDRAYRFGSLTDAEQKKILDEVLGVERFALAGAAARRREADLRRELEGSRADRARAEAAVAETEEQLVDLRAKEEGFAADKRSRVEAARARVSDLRAEANKARRMFDVDKLRADVAAACDALAAADKVVEDAVAAEARAHARVTAARAQRDEARVALNKIDRQLMKTCHSCGQEVTAKARRDLKSTMADVLARCEKTLEVSEEAEAVAEKKLAAAKASRSGARDAHAAAVDLLDRGAQVERDATRLREKIVDAQAKVVEIDAEVSPYAALAEKAETRLAKLARAVEACEEAEAVAEKKLRGVAFWTKAFGNQGLRSLLLDTSLPLLNEEAARVSRAVTGGTISVEFSATSEQKSGKVVDRFEVRVDNRHGAGDYRGNSSGERAKVDLCVGLALQRLVAQRSRARFNLAFYDEVFDHVDAAGTERVIDVLSDLTSTCESVFVVSHNEDLKPWFPSTLRIVKEDGVSRVEEG